MHKRGLCCSPASLPPSVCPSVTFVHSIQTAKDIFKLLCRPGSPIILVFLTPSADTQFQGEPLQRGCNTAIYTGWEKFVIFDRNYRLSQKRYEIDPWLLCNVNRKSRWRIDPCRFRWPWVTLKGGTRGWNLQADLINNAIVPFDVERQNWAG